MDICPGQEEIKFHEQGLHSYGISELGVGGGMPKALGSWKKSTGQTGRTVMLGEWV